MKKIIVLLVVVLLAACQSTSPVVAPVQETTVIANTPVSPPTSADVETLAGTDALVKGIWYLDAGMFYIYQTGSISDLALTMYNSEGKDPWEEYGTGLVDFENGKLTYRDTQGTCDNAQPAVYEFYIVKHEEKTTGAHQKLVGEDTCADRKAAMDGKFYKYVGFPSIFLPDKTEERLANSGAEMVGIWYVSSVPLFNEIKGDVDTASGNANLTSTLYLGWSKWGTGDVKYEDGKLTFLMGDPTCEGAPPATYEITMILHDDKIIAMKPKLIGEDACMGRKQSLDGQIIQRVTP